MDKRIVGAAAAALMWAAGAQAASAAIITYTYTGKAGGLDLGVFNESGALFNGADFTATFRRDDSFGHQSLNPYDTFVSDQRALSGELTINGVTWVFGAGPREQSQFDQPGGCGPGCDVEEFLHSVRTETQFLQDGIVRVDQSYMVFSAQAFGLNLLPSPDIDDLPSIEASPGLAWNGRFVIKAQTFDTHTFRSTFQNASGDFQIERLTVSRGVPEPAAWLSMILGFAGIGGVLRSDKSRRGASAPAAPGTAARA